jgi:hypothetical protein
VSVVCRWSKHDVRNAARVLEDQITQLWLVLLELRIWKDKQVDLRDVNRDKSK